MEGARAHKFKSGRLAGWWGHSLFSLQNLGKDPGSYLEELEEAGHEGEKGLC